MIIIVACVRVLLQVALNRSIMASPGCLPLLGSRQLSVRLVDCLKNPAVLRPETCTVKRGKCLIQWRN